MPDCPSAYGLEFFFVCLFRIAEALRADSIAKTPHGLLSRGAAGVLGSTLVVNLPGSTGAVRDGIAVLQPVIGHAIVQLRGGDH